MFRGLEEPVGKGGPVLVLPGAGAVLWKQGSSAEGGGSCQAEFVDVQGREGKFSFIDENSGE